MDGIKKTKKRYYLSSFLWGLNFKEVGPFRTGPFGRIVSNWEYKRIRIERKNVYGNTMLYIYKGGKLAGSYNISTEDREKNIEEFETKVRELAIQENNVGKQEHVSAKEFYNSILIDSVDKTIVRLEEIKQRLKENETLSLTQIGLLKSLEIM